MTPTTIMLIDDNPVFLRIASLFLESNDELRVVSVLTRGGEALEKAKEHQPDIVIIDLSMPDEHGLEVIPKLREAFPNMGVIALTLHDTPEYREEALRLGADAFISKPEMHNELLATINYIYEVKEKGQEQASIKEILVLEDDSGLRNIYMRALKASGFSVRQANTLESARQMLQSQRFDLFICDIHIRRENSIRLLTENKDLLEKNGTRIVIISGDSNYEYVAESVGAELFMYKPVSLSTLLTLVQRVLEPDEVEA